MPSSRGVRWLLGAFGWVAGPNWRSSSAGIARAAILHNVMLGGLHPPCEPTRQFGRGDGLAKIAEKCPLCTHVLPMADGAIEHSQRHGTLVFMATEQLLRQQRGGFGK